MIFYYLDASAWVKRYYNEAGTNWVQDLFARNEVIACASLGLIEVMATLSRKRKAREITAAQFKLKARELEDDWAFFIQVQLTAEVVNNATELTKNFALRGADAVHLSSALILQKHFQDKKDRLIIVTSDHELRQAVESSGVEVIDPAEAVPPAAKEEYRKE